MEIYKPDHFNLYEFVPPEIYIEREQLAWELLDPKMVYTWDELRKRTGKSCTINNWKSGGNFRDRGLRTFLYYKDGKVHYSQHIFGKAGDGDVYDMTPEEVINFIVEEKAKGSFQYLTGIEVGENWVHLDTRPALRVSENGLFMFDRHGPINWEDYVWPLK